MAKVIQVTQYEANDGSLFLTEAECDAHDFKLLNGAKIDAAKEAFLVVHAHGFIMPGGTHRHHQGQQMVFLRMGHAGGRRVLPVDQSLRTLLRIGGDQGLLQPVVELH